MKAFLAASLAAALLLAAGCGSSSVSTSISRVQLASFSNGNLAAKPSVSSYSATFNNPVTNGDLIVVAFWWDYALGATISSVTDSVGNSYSPILQTPVGYADVSTPAYPAPDWSAWIYAAKNVVGSGNLTVTVTVSYANSDPFSMTILEYSGVSSLDVTSVNGGTGGTALSSGNATTNHPDELVLGVAVGEGNIIAASGYNMLLAPGFCVEEKIVTSAGSYDAEFVMTTDLPDLSWEAGMATFY